MKKILKHTLLFLALLAGAFTAQAQVKIGNAPTVIEPNSNLEVQAAGGQKVIVNKTVGTVQVDNLPSGDILDSIVTQDPTTKILRRVNPAKLSGSLTTQISSMSARKFPPLATSQAIGPLDIQRIDFDHVDYDPEGMADTGTNKFTAIRSGYYSYYVELFCTIGQPVNYVLYTIKNGPAFTPATFNNAYIAAYSIDEANNSNGYQGAFSNMSGVIYLNANDKIDFVLTPCYNCGATVTIIKGRASLQYLGN